MGDMNDLIGDFGHEFLLPLKSFPININIKHQHQNQHQTPTPTKEDKLGRKSSLLLKKLFFFSLISCAFQITLALSPRASVDPNYFSTLPNMHQ